MALRGLDQGAGGNCTNSGLCIFEGKCIRKLLSKFVVFKLPLGLIWKRLKPALKFFLRFGFHWAAVGVFLRRSMGLCSIIGM